MGTISKMKNTDYMIEGYKDGVNKSAKLAMSMLKMIREAIETEDCELYITVLDQQIRDIKELNGYLYPKKRKGNKNG
jgi:hypothetical protein